LIGLAHSCPIVDGAMMVQTPWPDNSKDPCDHQRNNHGDGHGSVVNEESEEVGGHIQLLLVVAVVDGHFHHYGLVGEPGSHTLVRS
jgi:hypothetical protein